MNINMSNIFQVFQEQMEFIKESFSPLQMFKLIEILNLPQNEGLKHK